jgi:hypothetical protein
MTWFLFVLYLHTDKPAEVYRWQFDNQVACVNAAKFVSQGNGIKAACIQDAAETGPAAYGADYTLPTTEGLREKLPEHGGD